MPTLPTFLTNHLTLRDLTQPPPPSSPHCPICHEDYENPDPTTPFERAVQIQDIPGCSHTFGEHCLLKWLNTPNTRRSESKTCPLCRTVWVEGGGGLMEGMGWIRRRRLEMGIMDAEFLMRRAEEGVWGRSGNAGGVEGLRVRIEELRGRIRDMDEGGGEG